MVQKISDSKNQCYPIQPINSEQIDCIVEAIVEGKYSWACVLILHFAGYNPIYYLPYRTYKRLLKEEQRQQIAKSSVEDT